MTLWPLLVALVACGIAMVTDLRSRTIPNWLTLPLALCGLLVHGLHDGVSGLLLACVGLLVCALPLYFLFVREALGGGDVKLLAALGALFGARSGLELELTAFALVALYALCVTAWRGRMLSLLATSARATLHLVSPKRHPRPDAASEGMQLPMGLAIFVAVGALAVRALC